MNGRTFSKSTSMSVCYRYFGPSLRFGGGLERAVPCHFLARFIHLMRADISHSGQTASFQKISHPRVGMRHQCTGADTPSAPQSGPSWQAYWTTMLTRIYADGHFASDPGITLETIETDRAATKRAVLSFSRQRSDILASLDQAHLTELVLAGLPPNETDRKTRNAYKRLEASFLRGQPLSSGDGGAADLQDVLRLILAFINAKATGGIDRGGVVPENTVNWDDERVGSAASEILRVVLSCMDQRQGPAAISEKARQMAGLRSGAQTQNRYPSGRGPRGYRRSSPS